MRDIRTIVAKLKIVFFYNVSNPEIQKHMEDCNAFHFRMMFRGSLGSFSVWYSICFVGIWVVL